MNTRPPRKLTIGRLAEAAGVGVETVRYYERSGLITRPVKPAGGHRVYPEKTLTQLRFIAHAKRCGFTLREITTLMALGSDHCAVTRELAVQKLRVVEEKITALQETCVNLVDLLALCDGQDDADDCGLFISLLEASRDGAD